MPLSTLLIFLFLAAKSAEHCTREELKCATDAYLSAQSFGSSDLLKPLISHNLTYTENDVLLDIKTGILSQALKIDHNMSIYDTGACSTFTEVVVANPEKPYVIITRMVSGWQPKSDWDDREYRYYDGGLAVQVSKESFLPHPSHADCSISPLYPYFKVGEQINETNILTWKFGNSVTGYLYYPTLESWTPIPASQRLSPSLIQSIGDDYFNRFDNVSVTVPWGPPCTRVEGGTLITGTLTGDNSLRNSQILW